MNQSHGEKQTGFLLGDYKWENNQKAKDEKGKLADEQANNQENPFNDLEEVESMINSVLFDNAK